MKLTKLRLGFCYFTNAMVILQFVLIPLGLFGREVTSLRKYLSVEQKFFLALLMFLGIHSSLSVLKTLASGKGFTVSFNVLVRLHNYIRGERARIEV
jgi:hypothetical protein